MYRGDSLVSNRSEFGAVVSEAISAFSRARVVRRLAEGTATMSDYHTVLLTIFPQTYDGPYNLALAASRCSWRHAAAKEYLVVHAAEESSHWKWILNDLEQTGYSGPTPSDLFPHPSCQTYLSFTEHVSERAPYARLATASVLEGIAAECGERCAGILIQQLGLHQNQATFFVKHAEADKIHSKEIADAIADCPFDGHEWGWMTHVAKMTGLLYQEMYNHDGYSS